jgi:hypothetical protein
LSSSLTKTHDWIKELGLHGLVSSVTSPSLEFSDQEESDRGANFLFVNDDCIYTHRM